MKKRNVMILAAVLGLLSAAMGRTWTNTEGKTLEADLVRVKGDTVYLEMKSSGKIHSLKLSVLSDADQEFVRQYEQEQASKKKAAELARRKATWLDDYDDVVAESKELGLPILLLYTAPERCGYCVKLEDNILGQKAFKEYANSKLVLFLADFSEPGDEKDWKEEYPTLIQDFPYSGYPCAYLISTGGKKLGRISGYDSNWSVQDYIGLLEKYNNNAK